MRHSFISFLSAIVLISAISCNQVTESNSLERAEPSAELSAAMDRYYAALDTTKDVTMHSIMVMQHGKVLAERWLNGWTPDSLHVMYSVSKTFTATAVGLAIEEGKINLTDKVISFFPDKLPAEVSDNLAAMTVWDLLTMSAGHDTDHTFEAMGKEGGNALSGANGQNADFDWVKDFLAYPVEHKPGEFYCYNSIATLMLSAIVQKVEGENVFSYLQPRLFEPLHISGIHWSETADGINHGGWGLFLKTEDMAKMGQLFLQNGEWNGKQLIPAGWIAEASKKQIYSLPAGVRQEQLAERNITEENSDLVQGYGYQMWRSRHNGYRADGAMGQFILIFPEKDVVIACTANSRNAQKELDLIYDNILSVL
jgi:CubicO group peptidase (beta-lactamase class C family)